MREYLTKEGFERFKHELHEILSLHRPQLVKVVAWAASNGDRSENGDYLYGKKKLREYDRRIRFLTKLLESAEVFQPEKQSIQRVVFGVWVKCLESGDSKWYRIVGSEEVGTDAKFISYKSPFARAILGKSEGDEVTIAVPKGERSIEIQAISIDGPNA